MFLAINIGNSAVKFGIFEGERLAETFSFESLPKAGVEYYLPLLRSRLVGKAQKAGIASVVPTLTPVFEDICRQFLSARPQILTCDVDFDFSINYDNPSQLGADRLANVAAARHFYGYPTIIVDIGTATTFDVIDIWGNFIGGLIAPGPKISAEALFARAAQLYPVRIEKPRSIIATNTSDAMRAGIYYGNMGQIDFIVSRIREHLDSQKISVVATGGFAELFGAGSKVIDVIDSHLTLKGIALLFRQ
jgi:type III pantothenate kinase